MKLGVQVGLNPPHVVLDGEPALPPQKGHIPQFLAHICCREMAGWIKIPVGKDVGLLPSDIVLDGNPAPPPEKKGPHPQFSVHVRCGPTAGWNRCHLVWR